MTTATRYAKMTWEDRAELAPWALVCELKRRRKEHEMTQAELAKLIGSGQSHISQIESGVRVPSLEVLCMIAGALGATIRVEVPRD